MTFPDTTFKNTDWIEVLPAAVSIADCSEPGNILYEFGYEALKSMRRGLQQPGQCLPRHQALDQRLQ